MSVFDLFRGFFGVPGGRHRGDGRSTRDPFFDTLTHDDEDDDDDEGGQDFFFGGYEGGQQDPNDDAMRFGFSFGPSGLRVQEPQFFGEVFKEMEELFGQLGQWERRSDFGNFGAPSIEPPPAQDGPGQDGGAAGGRSLRDFMLKSPESPPHRPSEPPLSSSPLPHWSPFPKFGDVWRGGLLRGREEEEAVKEDRDLDSRVTSEGLDQILTPGSAQPRFRSYFQSVTVSKVVKSDGTVEERRTVCPPSADHRDEGSIFAKYFEGFKGR
ncbi:hypothetical protein COCON_G00130010 [Conger conger]|uniref:HCLS1-associated protein X-1 n=1 Tax=Conger conger TaxID=82655 RepID=A0A9Q1DDR4_CONCO|nr:hypothetical protein COCON_G00130010 [Conger conger]